MPNIYVIQSEFCDPLYAAKQRNLHKPVKVNIKATLAEGIAIGEPMRGEEILELAYKYNIKFIHTPEDRILEARQILARKGIYCEHTTAANYAAYLEYCDNNGKLSDSLITICGAGLKSDH